MRFLGEADNGKRASVEKRAEQITQNAHLRPVQSKNGKNVRRRFKPTAHIFRVIALRLFKHRFPCSIFYPHPCSARIIFSVFAQRTAAPRPTAAVSFGFYRDFSPVPPDRFRFPFTDMREQSYYLGRNLFNRGDEMSEAEAKKIMADAFPKLKRWKRA